MEGWQAGLLVDAYAVNAEIEMMKAVNKEREMKGQSLAFTEEHFTYCQQELIRLAREIKIG